MPFEIFLIPGLIFGLFGFYRGLKVRDQLDKASKEKYLK
jgi:hypothetical protein